MAISKVCLKTGKSCTYSYQRFACRCDTCVRWHNLIRAGDLKAKERSRLWRLKFPERSRSNSLNYQRTHPEQVLKWKLKRYGITPVEYRAITLTQDDLCAICRKEEPNEHKYTRLAVDHCHKTGKVRGLLCSHCNTGLGKFRDSVILLEKAIQYLKKDYHGTI